MRKKTSCISSGRVAQLVMGDVVHCSVHLPPAAAAPQCTGCVRHAAVNAPRHRLMALLRCQRLAGVRGGIY